MFAMSRRMGCGRSVPLIAAFAMMVPVIVAAQSPGITSEKTVGLDPQICATTPSLTLPPGGGYVVYCYEVTNTGDISFTTLDLVDSELGVLLSSFSFTLIPGSSVFVTQSAVITSTTTNIATWNASSITPTSVVTATDSALVTVEQPAPAIVLVKTVGTDPNLCAPTGQLTLPPGGGTAVYCYEVTNTGNVSLTNHDLVDDQLGTLLNSFAYALLPGGSVFLTQAATITETTVNSATWTASGAGVGQAAAVDQAIVTVEQAAPAIVLVKTVGTDPNLCAPTGQLTLPPGGGTAVYCYEVTNTGNVSLTTHDLVDDQLGAILSSFAYALLPGSSVFVTQAATVTETTVNNATWTASGAGVGQASADDQAIVTVRQTEAITTLSPAALLLLVLLISGAGLIFVRRLA